MATKDHKRLARGMIESLESRIHLGPPVCHTEIHTAREYLRQNAFSPASDYFQRLERIQGRLHARPNGSSVLTVKRNYGGQAAGYWMQVQSAYDHVILSTCYEGEFHLRRGRVKISHRFNQAGRIDFVELKFLRSLQPVLDGEVRSLVRVKDYQTLRKDWHAAIAFVLPVLPSELVFLYEDIFRCPRPEVLAWLVNIGHRLVADMLDDLRASPAEPLRGNGGINGSQLSLPALHEDEVALPILEHAAFLESVVEVNDPKTVLVRYNRK